MEENSNFDFSLEEPEMVEMKPTEKKTKKEKTTRMNTQKKHEEDLGLVNCLRNVIVNVKFVGKNWPMARERNHELFGGMARGSFREYCCPTLRSGGFDNVLTNAEKEFLEDYMGLEYNALSVYKKENNFWETGNGNGIAQVKLQKGDNFLDLSKPEDYIKYKILLKYPNEIASSMAEYRDHKKPTHMFVIIEGEEELADSKMQMDNITQCYIEFGRVKDDKDVLRTIVEFCNHRTLDRNSKLTSVQVEVNKIIQDSPKKFLEVIQDGLFPAKVLIRKCVDNHLISVRGGFYYLLSGDKQIPMCEDGQDPVISNAARWIIDPRHQDTKFTLEAKVAK